MKWVAVTALVWCVAYLLSWLYTVVRLNDPQFRPRLEIAATVLAHVDPKDSEAGASGPTLEEKLTAARRRFPTFGPTTLPCGTPVDEQKSWKWLTDLGEELSRLDPSQNPEEFAETLSKLERLGQAFRFDPVPKRRFLDPRRDAVDMHGLSFSSPIEPIDLRKSARMYLNYRNALLWSWPPEELAEYKANARFGQIAPMQAPANSASHPVATKSDPFNVDDAFRSFRGYAPPSILAAPWTLLEWSDPSFVHNVKTHPFAVTALTLVTFFFLTIRFGGNDRATGQITKRSLFTSTPRLRWRPHQHSSNPLLRCWGRFTRRLRERLPSLTIERLWLLIGLVAFLFIQIAAERHETMWEYLSSIIILPWSIVMIVILLGSLAAMCRTRVVGSFLAQDFSARIRAIPGVALAIAATVILCLWMIKFSTLYLLLSLDPGRMARGLLQNVVAGVILYQLCRLFFHLFLSPAPHHDEKLAVSELPDVAVSGARTLLAGSLVALFPFAGTIIDFIAAFAPN